MSKITKFSMTKNDKVVMARLDKADRKHYIEMLIEAEAFAEESKNRRGKPSANTETEVA